LKIDFATLKSKTGYYVIIPAERRYCLSSESVEFRDVLFSILRGFQVAQKLIIIPSEKVLFYSKAFSCSGKTDFSKSSLWTKSSAISAQ
jgi:hypothetical protein